MGATTYQYLYKGLYWIEGAVFINTRREKNENKNKTLDLQKIPIINMTSVTKILRKVLKWIIEAVWR